jgi:small subunit ribosomal protein S6
VKRPYESVIVFDGTLPDDILLKEQTQIEEFLKQNATVEKVDVWGKRSLAYLIRKKKLGYYCLYQYEGEGAVTGALERHIKLNERVLRHLTVVRDMKNEKARAEFFAKREKAAEEAMARAEAERQAAAVKTEEKQ